MDLKQLLTTDDGSVSVPDEAILNVLRTHEGVGMGTTEIADAIDMSRQGTMDRLNQLHEDERVRCKRIGDYAIWDLHPEETADVIPPEIDRLSHLLSFLRARFWPARRLGTYFMITGLVLLVAGIADSVGLFAFDGPAGRFANFGVALILGGAAMWEIAGGSQLLFRIVERTAYWWLTGEWRFIPNAIPGSAEDEQRAEASPRLILGLFLLVLVGGALLRAAGDLFRGLLRSEFFSPVGAAIITILFLVVLVVAILGAD